MIWLLLDTSTRECHATLCIDGVDHSYTWQTDRNLARDLLGLLRDALAEHTLTLQQVDGIGVYQGPGSFTGLRIGLTVANTIAHDRQIPIVGATGPDWRDDAKKRLAASESDHIVMPVYGAEAHITMQKK